MPCAMVRRRWRDFDGRRTRGEEATDIGDLTDTRLIYLKGILFLICGSMAAGLLVMETPTIRTALLLGLAVWCSARSYYFAFYVIEHYVDGSYRYAGLTSFIRYQLRRSRAKS